MNKPFSPPDCRNLELAIHAIGKNGNADQISELTGKNRSTIFNELNPDNPHHKLGLIDSLTYQSITQDFSVLYEYAASLGHVAAPVADFAGVSDVELLTKYSDWAAALSKVHEEISRAFSDHKIQRHEFHEIQRVLNRSMAVGMEFLIRLEAVICDDSETAA